MLLFSMQPSHERGGNESRAGNPAGSKPVYKGIPSLREFGFIALTIPDSPQNKDQKMRITPRGLTRLSETAEESMP